MAHHTAAEHRHHDHSHHHHHAPKPPPKQYNIPPPPADNPFLTSLLTRTLRVTTTDGRMFLGDLKCMDRDRNLILARTYEYRTPTTIAGLDTHRMVMPGVTATTTTTTTTTSLDTIHSDAEGEEEEAADGVSAGHTPVPAEAQSGGEGDWKIQLELKSRYLGLVVVPGDVIVKVELEVDRSS
ncbi:hypothetical protein DFH27DRAFT_163771 [Peziza echinospora]|nr:hypothetical protein DFH27DRAFT_163771 [Peziza echinospora]